MVKLGWNFFPAQKLWERRGRQYLFEYIWKTKKYPVMPEDEMISPFGEWLVSFLFLCRLSCNSLLTVSTLRADSVLL